MAIRHSNAYEAKEIANYSMHWLSSIRQARTLDALTDAWGGWKIYADGAGVCRQIREHMASAYAEVAADIKANRVIRDPSGSEASP